MLIFKKDLICSSIAGNGDKCQLSQGHDGPHKLIRGTTESLWTRQEEIKPLKGGDAL